jgi:hypothetical protein
MKTIIYILSLCGIVLAMASCESSISPDDQNPGGETFSCMSFAYPDTIFYVSDSAVNVVRPTNPATGTYTVFPEGLFIDGITGEIDINKSESGLRYRVSFQPTGSSQVCNWEMIIAGINYEDKIYILDQNDTLALPIFDANRTAIIPCDDDDDDDDDEDEDEDEDDDDDSCKFDDDEGTGAPTLASLGIKIGTSSGKINLKKTLENGTFGASPVNGTTVDAKLFYRLNDASLRARNSLDIRLYYFEKLADVPQSLLDEIEEKKNSILKVNVPVGLPFARVAAENPKAKPRPPYLVVVGRLQ